MYNNYYGYMGGGYYRYNPYGLNFSRSYPRVVVYGQQNFGVLDSVKKAGRKAALAAALLGAGIPGASSAGKVIGEHTAVPLTHEITQPLATEHLPWQESVVYGTVGPTRHGHKVISSREYVKSPLGSVHIVEASGRVAPYMRSDLERLKKHYWPDADFEPAYNSYGEHVVDEFENGSLKYNR